MVPCYHLDPVDQDKGSSYPCRSSRLDRALSSCIFLWVTLLVVYFFLYIPSLLFFLPSFITSYNSCCVYYILFKMVSEEKVMSDEKQSPVYDGKGGVTESSSDAEHGSGIGHVEVIETTKRGLKARHAQMIALGGTIGKIFPRLIERYVLTLPQALDYSLEVEGPLREVDLYSFSLPTVQLLSWFCLSSLQSLRLLLICLSRK